MYRQYFELKANPFNANPDPRYLYTTAHIQEALACLIYGVQKRKGFVMLSGEVGTGKTTLLQKLLQWLRTQQIATAYVFNPLLNVNEFLEYMLNDFGVACPSNDKNKMLVRLNEFLLERYRLGQTAVLIVDEAQNLTFDVLEEVRLLTNLETSTEKLLQIVLSGQPELDLKMKEPRLRQLRQRITLRCKTHPLSLSEVHGYIQLRLRLAGGNGQAVFTEAAIDSIYYYSQGIPRVINLLCEHALITAFADQQRPVPVETIETVAREFELDEIAPIFPPTGGENLGVLEGLKVLADLKRGTRDMARARAEGEK